jgi:predicted small integral membrane protein
MENTSLVAWMAWTRPTAAFFAFVALCLISMSVWEYAVPGGAPLWVPLGISILYAIAVFRWV